MRSDRAIVGWFTMNGKHIPIFDNESKQMAVNRAIAESNEQKKHVQINSYKAEADKLNGKSVEYKSFKADENPNNWIRENTNIAEWGDSYFVKYSDDKDDYGYPGLTEATETLYWYTASGYGSINYALYNERVEDIDKETLHQIEVLNDAISRFKINSGLEVTRESDFRILGAKNYAKMTVEQVKEVLSKSDGVMQNDAFMSFSMDNRGRAIMGKSGLVTHLRIPPSKGAGMCIAQHSAHPKENEFLLNNNAVLKYDLDNITQDENGKIHVYADWLGQADRRTIDRRR